MIENEENPLHDNLQKIKEMIEESLGATVNLSLESSESLKPFALLPITPPCVWVPISVKETLKFWPGMSAAAQVLKEYQEPKGTYWFDVRVETIVGGETLFQVRPSKNEKLSNTSLRDDFSASFKKDYNQRLPIEKNKQNLERLAEILRDYAKLKVSIPGNEQGVKEIQFKITDRELDISDLTPKGGTVRPEELSAVNLALKETGINFRRDDNDPSIFSPLPGSNIKMMEIEICDEFEKSYNKYLASLKQAKAELLANRTLGEKSVDWLQGHPKTTFGLSIVGFCLALIPGIILVAVYFGSTNSTKPVNDFITALGKGDQNCMDAQAASDALPSQNMKTIAGGIITNANNALKVQRSTDDTTSVQKPEEFESLLPDQPEQQIKPSGTDSGLKPKQK